MQNSEGEAIMASI